MDEVSKLANEIEFVRLAKEMYDLGEREGIFPILGYEKLSIQEQEKAKLEQLRKLVKGLK